MTRAGEMVVWVTKETLPPLLHSECPCERQDTVGLTGCGGRRGKLVSRARLTWCVSLDLGVPGGLMVELGVAAALGQPGSF